MLWINPTMCEWFYPNDINNWWQLRLGIYSLVLCLLFIINTFSTVVKLEKYFNFTIYVGIGLTSSDCIDRLFLNIDFFTWMDLIMVSMVLLIGYRKYLCQITTLKH